MTKKEVTIVIANRDSYEAIQVTIESIRKFTSYPYQIIVYDDNSKNGIDLPYLRECAKADDFTLIESLSGDSLWHGGALNVLLNTGVVDTDYAMVIDCDVLIKGYRWLEHFIKIVETDKSIIAVVDEKKKGYTWVGYRTPIYHFWFGFINMIAYRDGMVTDWDNDVVDRRDEPFKTIFADLYPPQENEYWQEMVSLKKILPEQFKENFVSNDVGAKLWLTVNYRNKNGYRVEPLTPILRSCYEHFGHASIIGAMGHSDSTSYDAQQSRKKFDRIKRELQKLRSANA